MAKQRSKRPAKRSAAQKKGAAPLKRTTTQKRATPPKKKDTGIRTVRIRKSIVTLDPGTGGGTASETRLHELEVENQRLKAQLADQRSSSTMFSAAPAPRQKSYKGLAAAFAITTLILIIVLLILSL